jgi:uncharacterized protein YjlB
MPLKDQVKIFAKKLVEDRPDPSTLAKYVRSRRPRPIMVSDDGIIPNHPRFPLLIYRDAVDTGSAQFKPGVVLDALFESNGWGRSWRDTVYDFVHFHSQIHEVMGIARGTAELECGGVKGKVIFVQQGDMVVLPAGTGHRLLKSSRRSLVVGAYPENGTYDECTDTRERPDAVKRIAKVPKPHLDPVYGKTGP